MVGFFSVKKLLRVKRLKWKTTCLELQLKLQSKGAGARGEQGHEQNTLGKMEWRDVLEPGLGLRRGLGFYGAGAGEYSRSQACA